MRARLAGEAEVSLEQRLKGQSREQELSFQQIEERQLFTFKEKLPTSRTWYGLNMICYCVKDILR